MPSPRAILVTAWVRVNKAAVVVVGRHNQCDRFHLFPPDWWTHLLNWAGPVCDLSCVAAHSGSLWAQRRSVTM